MEARIEIIAREINITTNEIVSEHTVFEKITEAPKRINDLGFNHKEQIEILYQSQEAILHAQEKIINEKNNTCPKCGSKAKKKGKFESDFHAVFTDHKISLQRTKCTCGWQSKISIDGTFGNALHPDLIEMQCLFGSEASFKKTEQYLNKKCAQHRPINSHSRVQRTINQVGEILKDIKQSDEWGCVNDSCFSQELILTIDGGHVQSHDVNSRSFEAMVATVYQPNHLVKKDKHHSIITKKTVVASAKNDRQASIKKLVKNACKREGMSADTEITALTDGAKNCWSVISSLEEECKAVNEILDWFHIGKKFKNTEHAIAELYIKEYDKAKWCLWHGNADKCLAKLEDIRKNMVDNKKKVTSLIAYIKNNKERLVNYQDRKSKGLAFTSQLAESTVNNVINERQKNDKRMQWSRDGSDSVLQLRSSKHSKDWECDWSMAQNYFYKVAA